MADEQGKEWAGAISCPFPGGVSKAKQGKATPTTRARNLTAHAKDLIVVSPCPSAPVDMHPTFASCLN
jgi:hypothetical protein